MSKCCQPRYVHLSAAGGTVPIDDDSGLDPNYLPLLLPGVVANTLAHLKALTTRPVSVALAGRDAPGDGQSGVYFWSAGSTATPDDRYVVAPDVDVPPGRWLAFGQYLAGTASSTSSVEIGPGLKTFVVSAAPLLEIDSYMLIQQVDVEPRRDWMFGQVKSNVDGQLVFDSQSYSGSGTYDKWKLHGGSVPPTPGISGAPGASRMMTVRLATTDPIYDEDMVPNAIIDSRVAKANDVVLRKNQVNRWDNGPFVINASGPATRHPFFQDFDDHPGASFGVSDGESNRGAVFFCVSSPGGTIGTTNLDFVLASKAESSIDFVRPLVYEAGVLRVPAFYRRSIEAGTYGPQVAPLDGALYTEVSVPINDNLIRRIYSDLDLADAGSNPVVVVSGSDKPLSSSWRRPEIGRAFRGAFKSSHQWVGGVENRGVVRNQFEEGNDPDNAANVTASASVIDVANPTLTGLGFVRGVQGMVNGAAAYGRELKTRTAGGEYFYGVVYVETDVEGAFGSPSFWPTTEGVTGTSVSLTLLKVYSTTLHSYMISSRFAAGVTGFFIGVKPAAGPPSGARFTACGAQFATQRGPIAWIRSDDYLSAAEQLAPVPVMSRDVYMLDDEMEFHWDSIVELADPGMTYRGNLSFPPAPGASPYAVFAPGVSILKPSRFSDGDTADLRLFAGNRNYSLPYQQPVRVHKRPGSGLSRAVKGHFVTDSIGNRLLLDIIKANWEATGETVTMIGTVRSSAVDGDPDNDDGERGEPREGRSWSELVNISTTRGGRPIPLPVGQEVWYMGQPKEVKVRYNPYLFPAADYPPGTPAYNGYVFDFPRYLSRFGLATPTHVANLLGFNDASYDAWGDIANNIAAAVPIFCDSVLRASETVKIGLGMSRPAYSQYGFNFRPKWDLTIGAIVKAANKYNDPRVTVIPVWAHMDPYAGYALLDAPAADVANGVPYRRAPYYDPRHPIGKPRNQYGASVTAWAVNV